MHDIRDGVVAKILAWVTLVVSSIWMIHTDYDFEPIICTLTGLASVVAVHRVDSFHFDFKSKFDWIRRRVLISFLSPCRVVGILNMYNYDDFKRAVEKYRFVQFQWSKITTRPGDNTNGFRFTYTTNEAEYFYHKKERHSYNSHIFETSFYSFRERKRKSFLRSINRLVKAGVFVKKSENENSVCKKTIYGFGIDEYEEKDGKRYQIEKEFIYADWKNAGQFSISFRYKGQGHQG